ncbi:MAG: Lipid A core - O-antigen ligase-like enzyme [Acidobacteria bacterium OLB17]|nr:MAG: Lipid A core - O-antigen ligase-like enzyme [Acidobacteria bacterium OLB17]
MSEKILFAILLVGPILACLLFGAVDSGTWALISVVAFFGTLLWAYNVWKSGEFSVYRTPLIYPFAAFFLLGVLQIAAGTTLDPYATRLFTFRLGVYLLFFLAALAVITTPARLTFTRIVIVLFGGILAFGSILQRMAAIEPIFGIRETPQAIPFGPFVNQHHFAAFMVMVCGLAFGVIFDRRAESNRKVVNIGVAAVCGSALLMTMSRGAWLAASVTLLVVLAATYATRDRKHSAAGRRRLLVPILSAVILIGATLGLALFLGGDDLNLSLAGHGSDAEGFSSGRTHFWAVAMQVFAAHPIAGAGLDSFAVAFTKFDTWDGRFRIERAHNDYLQVLADGGVIGFLCLASFIAILFRKGVENIRFASTEHRSVAIGAFAGCVGVLVHSFVDFPLRTPSNAFFFLLLVVLAVVRTDSGDHFGGGSTVTSASAEPHGRLNFM